MKTLELERRDGYAIVRLHRPERKNALDDAMYDELLDVAAGLAASASDDRAVVLTGSGDAFCSGADLSDPGGRDQAFLTRMRKVGAVCLAIHALPQPTVSFVNGPAVGAGFGLALACDLVVASADARFLPTFSRLGLSADFGISWVLPRLVGPQRAMELLLLASELSAGEALDWGVVNRVVDADGAEGLVCEWARELAAGPPLALRATKHLLNQAFDVSLADSVEAEAQAQARNVAADDFREVFRARRDGRRPEYRGR